MRYPHISKLSARPRNGIDFEAECWDYENGYRGVITTNIGFELFFSDALTEESFGPNSVRFAALADDVTESDKDEWREQFVRELLRTRDSVLAQLNPPGRTPRSYCEDYPACGHTPSDPCDDTGLTAEDYFDVLSRRDYDPYYDPQEY